MDKHLLGSTTSSSIQLPTHNTDNLIMNSFAAFLLVATLAVATGAPSGLWAGHGVALGGPVLGPSALAGPVLGPTAQAGPQVGPAKISGAVDGGAVVTGSVQGPSVVSGSVTGGTAVTGWGGPWGDGNWGAGHWGAGHWGAGALGKFLF